MILSQQLAPSIDPLVREYIDARLAEAIGKVEERVALERAEREAIVAAILNQLSSGGAN